MNTHNLHELCSCGHRGGFSPNGEHKARFQEGHGECKKCDCEQFTWVDWCDEKGIKLNDSEKKIRMQQYKSWRGREQQRATPEILKKLVKNPGVELDGGK